MRGYYHSSVNFFVFCNKHQYSNWKTHKLEFNLTITKVNGLPDSADLYLACTAGKLLEQGYRQFILLSKDKMIFSVLNYLVDNGSNALILSSMNGLMNSDYRSGYLHHYQSLDEVNDIKKLMEHLGNPD
jgi:hypothetical protein